jgi:BirA family transcriptional regulator, biotin operon repressor / biotin---[acetyl-CoA-carboxylase] ligase
VTPPLMTPIRWPLEAIWEAVAPGLPGFTAEVLPSIDSSNTELMRRLRGSPTAEPRPEPTLLVAEQQTAGRGRLGRSWLSQRGDSLTFSLGLPLQPVDWSGLSLVVGISLAESLEPASTAGKIGNTAPRIGLKWPNDLWLAGNQGKQGEPAYSKLAGILVETASWEGLRYVVIGVGINIRALELPALTATESTSGLHAPLPPGHLQALRPELDAAQTLLRVIPPLVQAVQAFEQFGFAPFQAHFARRDVLSGRAVALSDGSVGTACGVGENGALLVHTPAGMKEITSSEVSVRPC